MVWGAPKGHHRPCVDHLPVVRICVYYFFHCPTVAAKAPFILHPSGFPLTSGHIILNCTEQVMSRSVCPLQSRRCSAMAATSSRARGMLTWAAPTQRSSPALTHTEASNTASASRQRAVSKPPLSICNEITIVSSIHPPSQWATASDTSFQENVWWSGRLFHHDEFALTCH